MKRCKIHERSTARMKRCKIQGKTLQSRKKLLDIFLFIQRVALCYMDTVEA
jgi:hypothetical protein